MKMKLAVAAFAAAVLAGCASSGARIAEVAGPPVVEVPKPVIQIPDWVTAGSTLNPDGSATIVGFSDDNWTSPLAAIKAARDEARVALCELVAADALGMRGGLSGIRSHPVINGKEQAPASGSLDALSLEERFAGEGFENSFTCKPPPTLFAKPWRDVTGVVSGIPGYYVKVLVPGTEMIRFYQATAQSSEARKKMLKAQRSLSDETEERIQKMSQRIRERAREWEQGKGVKLE